MAKTISLTKLLNTEPVKSKATKWRPVFSRMLIEPITEGLSNVIIAEDKDVLKKGRILALGPLVGQVDGKSVEQFKVGQVILYLRAHEIKRTEPDGTVNVFLREDEVHSILAVEDK
ncbi:MAG: hypothetical protein ACREQ5_10505 [Candidatus Dormibacteria bacterium]